MIVGNYEIRVATNEDGPDIRALWKLNGSPVDCEFKNVANAWVVAERQEGVGLGGAIQLFHSRPMSHIDNLLLDKVIYTRDRTQMGAALIQYASALLTANGAEFVTTLVNPERQSWCRHAVRQGWVPLWPRLVMAKRAMAREADEAAPEESA